MERPGSIKMVTSKGFSKSVIDEINIFLSGLISFSYLIPNPPPISICLNVILFFFKFFMIAIIFKTDSSKGFISIICDPI